MHPEFVCFRYRLQRADMVWLDNQATEGVEAWMDLCSHGFKNAVVRGGLGLVVGAVNVLAIVVLIFVLSWRLGFVALLGTAAVLLLYV